MIIDFRVRPPLKGFEKLSILGPQKGFQLYPFNFEDTEEIPSALQLSMPLFLKEMEEAGIGLGVVLPRVTNIGWGGVTNDEVAAGVAEYSDKLIGFGGVSVDGGIREAVQEVERAVTKLGLKGIVVEPGCCVPPRYPDANVMYPIYDRCAELGVPVVISQRVCCSVRICPMLSLNACRGQLTTFPDASSSSLMPVIPGCRLPSALPASRKTCG